MTKKSLMKWLAMGVSVAAIAAIPLEAQAVAVSASTSVFSLTDTSGLLTFSNNSYFVEAQTPIHDEMSTGSTPASFTLNDFPSSASASADADGLFPLDTAAGVNAGLGTAGRASGTAAWYVDWTASASGTVNIDLSYLFSYTVQNLAPGETGIASSSISISQDGTQNQSESLKYFNNVNGNDSGLTDALLTFAVTAGQTGSLSIVAASNAVATPVPLPAAMWLLVSALAGGGAFTRWRPASTNARSPRSKDAPARNTAD